MTASKALHPPARLLLGPGPSNVEERVLRAMSAQVVGYFDPWMSEITGEIHRLLNWVYGTGNRATFPVSGTGSAGMEAALINLIEPGDKVLIGHNGFFGDRMVEVALTSKGIAAIVE